MPTHQLVVPAKMSNVADLCVLVGRAAKDAGFDSRAAYACELAVGEACENIILHGYQGESKGDLSLSLESKPGHLTLTLQDSAPPFNPAVQPSVRDWDEEDPPVGGLGLVIIHRAMDEVHYQRLGKHNVLRMQKSMT